MGRRTRPRRLSQYSKVLRTCLGTLAWLALPVAAADPPPDADLLEFLAQWGEAGDLLDQTLTSDAGDERQTPPPTPQDEADEDH